MGHGPAAPPRVRECRPSRHGARQCVDGDERGEPDRRIRTAAREHGCSLRDIGGALGPHVSTISRILSGASDARLKT